MIIVRHNYSEFSTNSRTYFISLDKDQGIRIWNQSWCQRM